MAKSFPNTGATVGLAADRTALTSPFAGMQFFETDTSKLYMYNGSSWFVIDWLGTWPSFWAKNTTGVTGPATVVFGTTTENIGSNFSTTTGLFTAPVSGIYSFSAQTIASINGSRWVFRKNGTNISGPTAYTSVTSGYTTLSASINTSLNSGETMGIYIEAGFWYGDTGSIHNVFSGTLVKPL